ncbi:MAG: adenine deaminase [Desulfohalobiaceae bacterium]
MQHLQNRIALGLGEIPADLLLRNVRLVNTLSGEIHACHLAVGQGLVLGFEEYPAHRVIDCQGQYLAPGFIESHMHLESTLLAPVELARAMAARGTAAVVCDPHEIANVLGIKGLKYMLQACRDLPVQIFFMLPSCVPATHLETAGAGISAADMQDLLGSYGSRFLGLAEVMNFPGVLARDPGLLAKLELTRDLIQDGHAPGLSSQGLNAYILAGPSSEHECSALEEGREKLRKGMQIFIRQGTSEQNMQELLPLVSDFNWPRFCLVSDDLHPLDLASQGHLDRILRQAVAAGLDPVRALQMVSINPARHFGLRGKGALAPGYQADMVLLQDLQDFKISQVFLQGRPLQEIEFPAHKGSSPSDMHLAKLQEGCFRIPAGSGLLRVIGLVPGQILTKALQLPPRLSQGQAIADPERDLAKLAVLERHRASGNIGLGFVQGLGLKAGALASTVAHDSHNLIIAGASDSDMLAAALRIQEMQGGMAVALDGRILAELPLPIAGLMSDQSLPEVVQVMHDFNQACRQMGLQAQDPFMLLSFLALPVIPELRLTDLGLVDVGSFDFVDLWTEEPS